MAAGVQLCGLVEENGGKPPVSEKHLVIKHVNAGCKRDVVVPEEEMVWKKMARVVTDMWECLWK